MLNGWSGTKHMAVLCNQKLPWPFFLRSLPTFTRRSCLFRRQAWLLGEDANRGHKGRIRYSISNSHVIAPDFCNIRADMSNRETLHLEKARSTILCIPSCSGVYCAHLLSCYWLQYINTYIALKLFGSDFTAMLYKKILVIRRVF